MAPLALSHLIRRNLILWTLVPGVVIVLLLGGYFAAWEELAFENRNKGLALSLARYTENYIQTARNALLQLAQLVPPGGTEKSPKALRATIKAFPEFDRIILLDSRRNIINSVPPGLTGAELPSIAEAVSASLNSTPLISPESGKLIVQLTQPVAGGGALIGELSLDTLQQALTGFLHGEQDNVILCDMFGNLIVHPDRNAVKLQTNIGHTELFKDAKKTGQGPFIARGSPGWQMGSVTTVPETDWLLLLYKSARNVFEPVVFPFAMLIVALLLFFAILATLLNREMNRLVVRPLTSFTQIIQRFAESGHKELRTPEARYEELASMAREFEAMAEIVQRREIELRLSEAKYRSIFENAMEGIFQSTPQGHVLNANPATAAILGFDNPRQIMEEVDNLAEEIYVHAADRHRFLEILASKGKVEDFEVLLRRRDGDVIWATLNARPIYNEEGKLVLVEGLLDDITARKHTEQKLAELNQALEQLVSQRTQALTSKAEELDQANRKLLALDELKSTFLSSVSHELRTPLTSVLGFAKLIHKDFARFFLPLAGDDNTIRKKGQRIRDNLNILEHEGERLTRIINDFLDLAKIESGHMRWNDKNVEPSALLRRIARAAEGMFANKPGVELALNLPPLLPLLHVDPDRIEQVLMNLLGNAAKFTAQGRVSLAACQVSEVSLHITVADTGQGIPAENQDKIFDKFQQVPRDDTRELKPEGTGLGLAICREIITHYRGRIWVESEYGKGSVFYVELPVVCAGYKVPSDSLLPDDSAGQAPLVLVVDDEMPFCTYIAQLLNTGGYRTMIALDGPAALEKARYQRPDCITMDIMMPGMDGEEVIRQLRADPALAEIPILVITLLQDYQSEEADATLRKPIEEKKLLAALDSLTTRARGDLPILALRSNGAENMDPYFSLPPDTIEYCNEAELWRRIDAGFQGMVVLPAWAPETIDMARMSSSRGLQVVILPRLEK